MGRAGAFEALPAVFAALVRVSDALRVDFLAAGFGLAADALCFTLLAAADFFFAELFAELFLEEAFLTALRDDFGEAFFLAPPAFDPAELFLAAAFLLPAEAPRLAPAADFAVRAVEVLEDVVFAWRAIAGSVRRPPQRSNNAVRSAAGKRPK